MEPDRQAVEKALGKLARAVEAAGRSMGPDARRRIGEWARLVVEWRTHARLTALASPEAVIERLMLPAVFALGLVEVRPDTTVVDLGCGSGCTGVALASAAAGGTWILVDAAEKKVAFCRYALNQCGMADMRAMTRQEALAGRIRADLVLARALPRTRATRADIRQLALPGAQVVRWVGEDAGRGHKAGAKCGSADLWVVVDPVECFT
jgi:16S rRNA G527 N7-methylase RsmG